MRIGIVGHFGGNENFTDGQTVKIKSLYRALIANTEGVKIDIVDSYYLKRNNLKLGYDLLKCLLLDKKIIFFPAFRGRKIFFKFFYYISKILKKEIYHDCIAGSLDKEILEHPEWIKYLNYFCSNWMESPEQVAKLNDMGITNCFYVPNFKHIEPVSTDIIETMTYNEPFMFCTFSRVEPKKGIEDALIAIKKINTRYNSPKAHLDVYGPIQKGHEDWFGRIVTEYSAECTYKGIAQPNESVEILKNYFALLFPTQYYTEGMPGTIIDAMFSGIPVIARRWAWCDNMVHNGVNGISYDFDHPELLESIIENVVLEPNNLIMMKENCIKESECYSESKIIGNIKHLLKL